MIIAKKKKEENIAEYVIYMWQVEDLIRASNFDIDVLKENIIDEYDVDDETRKEIYRWYEGLIRQMKDENIREEGHLQFIKNQIEDLYDFHHYLLKDNSEKTYFEIFNLARPNIDAFREKTKNKNANEVELAFEALYSKLLMRLNGKKISEETEKAMTSFSNFLGILSAKYLEFHRGEEELKT